MDGSAGAGVSGKLRIKRCRSNLHAQPCWHGYCADCGETLTAFDFSEEDCLKIGAGELDKHVCPKANAEKQLSL